MNGKDRTKEDQALIQKVLERLTYRKCLNLVVAPVCSTVSAMYLQSTIIQTEAAHHPRVMKRWAEDCKPTKWGQYWYRNACDKHAVICEYDTEDGWRYNCGRVSGAVSDPEYWLELESNPVLPHGKA